MASKKEEIEVPPLPKCYICDKEFDQFSLEEHYFTFHNDEATEESMKKQNHTIHKDHIHKCKSCGKSRLDLDSPSLIQRNSRQ